MEFKRIPAGSFPMGFEGEPLDASRFELTEGLYNEHPAHLVTISNDFYLGTYEVAIGEYQRFAPDVLARYVAGDPRSDDHPVYRVTWDEADAFCRWLTENDPDGHTYRLPTEAEWEYAARAGTTTPFHTGAFISPTEANLGSWSQWTADPVGSYAPNPWGLYDMHGNAEEWVLDWYGPYPDAPLIDPVGSSTGDIKVIRSLSSDVFAARSAARGGFPPAVRVATRTGFRVVISEAKINFQPAARADGAESRSDVATSRPAPDTMVEGETFTVEEGFSFSRVALTRAFYSTQKDEAVYVSEGPIQGQPGRSRAAAGLFARDLSLKYGVLFRIANKYELNGAGTVAPPEGALFLTIIPDVRYQDGLPHPDVSYRETRWTKAYPDANGPLYARGNMSLAVEEAPNGDLLSTWSTGEDGPVNSLVIARLRWGADEWDPAEFLVDVPLRGDNHNSLFNNGRGRLFSIWPVSIVRFRERAVLQRFSDDSGVSWSPIQVIGQGGKFFPFKRILAEEEGSLIAANVDEGLIHSVDDGLSWQRSPPDPAIGSSHAASSLLDDSSLLILRQTSGGSGPASMEEVRTKDLGATWSLTSAPFNQRVSLMIKLHSGRLLLFTYGNGGNAIAESVDQGETWFARSKHDVPALGYSDVTQSKDGIVHFIGELVIDEGFGPGRRSNQGRFPLFSFSEQWLREKTTCLDVSEWGVDVPGRIGTCPPENDDYIGLKAAGG